MINLWTWVSDLNNSKTAAAVLFMATFIAICLYIYVFAGKKKKKEYDDGRYIALFDDMDLTDLETHKQTFLSQQAINQVKKDD